MLYSVNDCQQPTRKWKDLIWTCRCRCRCLPTISCSSSSTSLFFSLLHTKCVSPISEGYRANEHRRQRIRPLDYCSVLSIIGSVSVPSREGATGFDLHRYRTAAAVALSQRSTNTTTCKPTGKQREKESKKRKNKFLSFFCHFKVSFFTNLFFLLCHPPTHH